MTVTKRAGRSSPENYIGCWKIRGTRLIANKTTVNSQESDNNEQQQWTIGVTSTTFILFWPKLEGSEERDMVAGEGHFFRPDLHIFGQI